MRNRTFRTLYPSEVWRADAVAWVARYCTVAALPPRPRSCCSHDDPPEKGPLGLPGGLFTLNKT